MSCFRELNSGPHPYQGCAQTRDPQLGRLVLYRLSYFRRGLRYSRLCGCGWIRTTEVEDSRFTVCPIWPLWNTPSFQSSLFKVHYFFACARASSRTRTNDRWITNLVLYQLSYRGVVFPLPTKKRAKVLLFFDMTKYFCKKMQFLVFFLVFAIFSLRCAGMSSHINALYLLKRRMGINLGGTQRSMT